MSSCSEFQIFMDHPPSLFQEVVSHILPLKILLWTMKHGAILQGLTLLRSKAQTDWVS